MNCRWSGAQRGLGSKLLKLFNQIHRNSVNSVQCHSLKITT